MAAESQPATETRYLFIDASEPYPLGEIKRLHYHPTRCTVVNLFTKMTLTVQTTV